MQRLGLLLLLGLMSSAALAVPLSWVASGNIQSSYDSIGALPLSATEGDPFSFRFVFDPGPDEAPQADSGYYRGEFLSASLTVAGQTMDFNITPDWYSWVSIDRWSGSVTVGATTTQDVAPGSLQFALQLYDSSTPFPSDDIPKKPPNLASYFITDFNLLSFNRYPTNAEDMWDAHMNGLVTSLVKGKKPKPVPEPATLALFAVGLAGLGFGRRRSK